MILRSVFTMFLPGYYFTRYKKNNANEALGREFKRRTDLKTACAYVLGTIGAGALPIISHTFNVVGASNPIGIYWMLAGALVMGLIGLEMGYRVGKAVARRLSLNHSTEEATGLYLTENKKEAKDLSPMDKSEIQGRLPLNPTHPEKYQARHKDDAERKGAQEALVNLHTAKKVLKASAKNFFGVLPKEKRLEKDLLNYAIAHLRVKSVDTFFRGLNNTCRKQAKEYLNNVIHPKA